MVFALALIACLLWGSAFSMIKLGYRFLSIGGTADQILFAGLRFTLAGILTVVIGKGIFKGSFLPKRSALPCMAWLALFQTILQYTLFYVSLAHLSGVRGSIINGTGTFWAILVACLIFKQEQLTARKLAGCAIGFLGILLVNLSGLHAGASFSVLGDGFMILSTIASSVSAALLRQFGSREAPYLLSGWQFFFGGLILTAAGWIVGGRFGAVTMQGIGILIYLALVSAVAYGLWALLLAHNPVSKVQIYFFVTPVAGVFLSAWLLGEKNQALGWPALLALICVSLGIYIVNRPSRIKQV
ncbi:DMT family transporter [Eubacteriaceae bacterium RF-744-FAT-4]|uniref:DMT family transporter n=1 Tax=Pseudoramibacter porci TaxID=2606631 RepID=A0A7X2TAP9_9FIRM|nr:DMT family transporter [Pseudoramibacter porci]